MKLALYLPNFRNHVTVQELADAGATLADIVRVHYIVPTREDFHAAMPVLAKVMGPVRPAATMICAGLLDERMRIEIEVTARVRAAA